MKQTVKMIVHAQFCKWKGEHGEYKFDVFNTDMSEYGYMPLQTIEIEFEVPTKNELLAGTVRALRAKLSRERSEASAKFSQMEQEINDLLALEYKPEPKDAQP